MTARTRYFVIVSLLVVGVGLGTGLVAYYVGVPAAALFGRSGPDELRMVPSTASVIAYADVREIMTSDLRQRVHQAVAPQLQENGRQQFQDETGINIETDIDRVVACLDPSGSNLPGAGLVLARGRFDEARIEALMREHGATVDSYKGKRLITAAPHRPSTPPASTADQNLPVPAVPPIPPTPNSFSLAFIEPGLAGFGNTNLVQHAIDLHSGGGASAVTNDELMKQVQLLDGNAWAVGRFDVLRSQARLPEAVASQLPPITWFSAAARIDSGLRGVVRAEGRDEAAAGNLRDVVRGFLALAKMQTSSRPDIQTFVNSIDLQGTGKLVSLSFDVPSQVFDALAAAHQKAQTSH